MKTRFILNVQKVLLVWTKTSIFRSYYCCFRSFRADQITISPLKLRLRPLMIPNTGEIEIFRVLLIDIMHYRDSFNCGYAFS